jgi:hypothetical protein
VLLGCQSLWTSVGCHRRITGRPHRARERGRGVPRNAVTRLWCTGNQPGGPSIRAARCKSPVVPLRGPVTLLGDDAERAERQSLQRSLQASFHGGEWVLRPHRSRRSASLNAGRRAASLTPRSDGSHRERDAGRRRDTAGCRTGGQRAPRRRARATPSPRGNAGTRRTCPPAAATGPSPLPAAWRRGPR